MDKPLILSTKKLDIALRERIVQNGFAYMEYDAINIKPVSFEIPAPTDYVIFSSKNAIKNVLKSTFALAKTQVLCIGEQSEQLLFENGVKAINVVRNMAELVALIEKISVNSSFVHFCGNLKLPLLSKKNGCIKNRF